MNNRTSTKFALITGAIAATALLASCSAPTAESAPTTSDSSSQTKSAKGGYTERVFFEEVCVLNKTGSAITYKYSGGFYTSGAFKTKNTAGEIPRNGTVCAKGSEFGVDITLPGLETTGKYWQSSRSASLNGVKVADLELNQTAYVEDAGYRMDVTYSSYKDAWSINDDKYGINTFTVTVY
ncbi:hypothetical protein [uncultured Aurantimicrobium sp.]|uniref:hypothetical protein n=1 Tax=uncultured Aurantimicrobium sp. TaxID=1705357 RepID=UPI00260AAAB7|nr:hypothetical protein [uncultured Aurantimicrobium sp.]